MDKIAPSLPHPVASPASAPLESIATALVPTPLRRPPPERADDSVKTLTQRTVSVKSSQDAEDADKPQPPPDIDDEIRNHPLVDMDEVPMNDTEELARLGGLNMRDEQAGEPDRG